MVSNGYIGRNPYSKGHTISENSDFYSILIDEGYEPFEVENAGEDGYLVVNPVLLEGGIESTAINAYLDGETETMNLIQRSPEDVITENIRELEHDTNSVLITEDAEKYEKDYLAFTSQPMA